MSKYEEDNSLYNDGEDRKPKLLILLGAIIIIVIILVLVISCGMKTKSSNNYLSYLKVNNATLTPAFDKNTTVYSLTTKEDVVAISCASESAKATTSGCNKRITLYDKSLTHTITVIAEDKGVRTYKISITKEEGSETPVVQITSTIDNNNTQKVKEAVLTSYVLPSDSVVTYQWYKNNEKIEGATSSEYKVTSTGDYYVEISKEGMQTPVASNVFTVNIEEEKENTIYEVMLGEISIEQAICKEAFDCLDVIPSNVNLAGAEIDLIDIEDREYILKKSIAQIRKNYDYIILDCPPSLSMLTVNAMTAADTVLVPIQCEYYALEGLTQLIHTINLVKKKLNPELELEGVVFTMYDSRTNLSLQVVENVKDNLKQNIYKTIIPRNIRLAEAPSHGLPINLYDTKSTGAESYRLLAEEVMGREE